MIGSSFNTFLKIQPNGMIMDCRTDSNFIMWPNKRLHTDAAALGGVSKDGRGGSGLRSLILLSNLDWTILSPATAHTSYAAEGGTP